MASIWWKEVTLPEFPTLQENIHTDVLVIGGGIAGLLCAYRLQQAGIDYALVEANTICAGVTKNTTAKLTAQHGLIYHKLVKKLGVEKARLYLQANQGALEDYRTLCRSIDCDFSPQDNYIYALDNTNKLDLELMALEKLGARAEFCSHIPLPMPTAGAVKFPDQAQFHPLKFLAAIAKGLRIYEHTPIRQFAPGLAKTDRLVISAEKIVVATHFPILNTHGSYFLKMFQHRSYCMALENVPVPDGMYLDAQQTGLSFRSHNGALILGGGGHRTGKEGGNWEALEAFAKKYYPGHTVRRKWATQDCMSLDGVPYIGHYSALTPDLYVATGFNKWGMTSSMVAANLLTAMIQGQQTPYAQVFCPSRSMLQPQLAANAWEAATNLLSLSKKRCPHLGCALKWNPQERTWDCPCHGSRFEESGKLIDNPAAKDLNS